MSRGFEGGSITRAFCVWAGLCSLLLPAFAPSSALAASKKKNCALELVDGPARQEIEAAVRIVLDPKRADSAEIRQKSRDEVTSALKAWAETGFPLKDTAKIVVLVSRHLELQGVAHEVTSEFRNLRIRILPQKNSKVVLNRVAHKLKEFYWVELFFEPARFSEKDHANASFSPPSTPEDLSYIQLGLETVKTPTRVDPTFAHEIVHSFKPRRLVNKQEYAFYGWVQVDSEDPKMVLPGSYRQKTYERRYSFDEIEAHYVQIKNLLHRGTGPSLRKAVAYSKRLSRLCQQTIEFVVTAKAHLAWYKNPVRFLNTPWGVQAVMRFELESVPIRLETYLVKAKSGRQKTKNRELFERQLDLLSTTARTRLDEARELRRKAERALKDASR